ncbi:hypothetical protein A0H81_11454 [Grifola frondosa]|uniref:Uncharacterized protein n=1 Tax=Grifola frondosa TaxID=5627 RepID=A0A1C7LX66_GRIFR|nr:hypothetical protein A0H81_11454 [Grifola frondosa]
MKVGDRQRLRGARLCLVFSLSESLSALRVPSLYVVILYISQLYFPSIRIGHHIPLLSDIHVIRLPNLDPESVVVVAFQVVEGLPPVEALLHQPQRRHREILGVSCIHQTQRCFNEPKIQSFGFGDRFEVQKIAGTCDPGPPSPISPLPLPPSAPGSRPGSSYREPDVVAPSPFYTNRPPAKSVSTVRSSEYDYDAASDPHSEPRTPSDHPRDRMSYQRSVMTLSEFDPFASGGVVVRHLPQDPNRLSVYSDSSMLDPHHKRADQIPNNRRSYGSSSSNSHGHSPDSLVGRMHSPQSVAADRRVPSVRSRHNSSARPERHTRDSLIDVDGDVASPRMESHHARLKTPSGSNSSASTVMPGDIRNRLSEPPNGQFLPQKRSSPSTLRSRGMTVASPGSSRPGLPPTFMTSTQPLQLRRKASNASTPSPSHTPAPSPVTISRTRSASVANSIESAASSPAPRPLVLIRKASSTRVNIPPLSAAPPMNDLPLPPIPPSPQDFADDMSPLEFKDPSSSRSSSLNFASPSDVDSPTGDAIMDLMRDSWMSRDSIEKEDMKGRRRRRQQYVVDGDLSAPASIRVTEGVSSSPPMLSKFPPVPPLQVSGGLESAHLNSPNVLKKISSQQSLLGRPYSATGGTSSLSGHDDAAILPPFTNPYAPMPALRHGNSHNTAVTPEAHPQSPASPLVEPRRGSVTSPRKRLFSNSSARRSTSSQANHSVEDDVRSVTSVDNEGRPRAVSPLAETVSLYFGSAANPVSMMTRNACVSPSSYWENTPTPEHSKRVSQQEYVPQYIMSPADMLKLEQRFAHESVSKDVEKDRRPKLDLKPCDFGVAYMGGRRRSRSNSILSNSSTGTLAFGEGRVDHSAPKETTVKVSSTLLPVSPSASRAAAIPHRKQSNAGDRPPLRSSSLLAKHSKHPALSARPSTAQPAITPPSSPGFSHLTHSPDASSISLPPPPRQRPSRQDTPVQQDLANKRSSHVQLHPLLHLQFALAAAAPR